MFQPFILLIAVVIFCIDSFAQEIPATNYQINSALHLVANESQSKSNGTAGFHLIFENSEFEVRARGTQIMDERAGKQMSEIELANIKKLFEARHNPYEGQITEVIQCDKNLKPRPFTFDLGKHRVQGVLAGANARKIFGVCAPDQLEYWASYFNFYDLSSHFVLEFRVFAKAKGILPSKIDKISDKLKSVSKSLLQVRNVK